MLYIHKVCEFSKGRTVDMKDGPVPDIQAGGFAALTHGITGSSLLMEFNDEFDNMRAQPNLIPVSREAMVSRPHPNSAPPLGQPTPSIPPAAPVCNDTIQDKVCEVLEGA